MEREVDGKRMHPIGVVAQRTGLTPDVLRVWERRYGVVLPGRTDSGQRLYSDADIERLRLLGRATAAGRNISQLLDFSDDELRDVVMNDDAASQRDRGDASAAGAPGADAGVFIELALERVTALDARGLESVLWRAAMLKGAPAFLETVAAPLFRRIGEEWHGGRLKVAQEHLATSSMRSVLDSLRNELMPLGNAPILLVGTPAEERHEVGALLVAAAAAAESWRVTYVGADLPAAELAAAALDSHSRAVAVSLVYSPDEQLVIREMMFLRAVLPDRIPVIAGGSAAAALKDQLEEVGLIVLSDLDDLRSWLRTAI